MTSSLFIHNKSRNCIIIVTAKYSIWNSLASTDQVSERLTIKLFHYLTGPHTAVTHWHQHSCRPVNFL